MAVTKVTQLWRGRSHSSDAQGGRTYRRKFDVYTDDKATEQSEVRQAVGVPRIGDIYPEDTGATVIGLQVEQEPNHDKLWHVTANYSTDTGNQNTGAEEENPLDRPAELEWSFVQFTKIAETDLNGEALLNSSGEIFDPPPEMDDSRPVLRIARNEAAFSAALAVDFMDAVNLDAFFGGQPGQVKVASISAVRQFENDVAFWRVVYEFHYRRELWDLRVLDQGFHTFDGVTLDVIRELVNNVDDGPGTFQPVQKPERLDGMGGRLAPPEASVYLPYQVYKNRTFADLGLP